MNAKTKSNEKNRSLALNKQTVKRLNVQPNNAQNGRIRADSWYSIIFLSCDGIC